jgi:hypothetical protein
VDRIKLAQDRDRWWALVNATGFHKMRGISWLAEDLFTLSRRALLHELARLSWPLSESGAISGEAMSGFGCIWDSLTLFLSH